MLNNVLISSITLFKYQVRSIDDFYVFEIVSLNEVILQLHAEENHSTVVKSITEFLLPFFYPSASGDGPSMGPEQVRKCLELISVSEVAAKAFYSAFHHFTSVGSAAKMSVLLLTLLLMDAAHKEHSNKPKKGVARGMIAEDMERAAVGDENEDILMNKENIKSKTNKISKRLRGEVEDTTKVRGLSRVSCTYYVSKCLLS